MVVEMPWGTGWNRCVSLFVLLHFWGFQHLIMVAWLAKIRLLDSGSAHSLPSYPRTWCWETLFQQFDYCCLECHRSHKSPRSATGAQDSCFWSLILNGQGKNLSWCNCGGSCIPLLQHTVLWAQEEDAGKIGKMLWSILTFGWKVMKCAGYCARYVVVSICQNVVTSRI